MIYLYPEQLTSWLTNKLHSCYLISGNDTFLAQESTDKICQIAKQHGFTESYSYSLDMNTDWNNIYHLSKSFSLFSKKQILILILPKSGPTAHMMEKLLKLIKLSHSDLLLILRGNKLTKAQENSNWYKRIGQNGAYINCLTPEQAKLTQWVTKRAKAMSITLDKQVNELLCYCYEGNLLAMNQILEQLSVLYPNGDLDLTCVKKVINNIINLTPYHLVNALLSGKIQRSWHILQQLQYENYEKIVLLRIIQRELLLLLIFKQQGNSKNLKELFNQHKIWKIRRHLIGSALQRLTLYELQQAIQLIAHIELHLMKNYDYPFWQKLETLIMILCGKSQSDSFIYDSIR